MNENFDSNFYGKKTKIIFKLRNLIKPKLIISKTDSYIFY